MAISAGWYVVLGFVVMALFGFLIWLFTELFKEKQPLVDKTIGINFCSHLSKGRFIGTETSITPAKDGRHLIKLSAQDLDVEKEDEEDVPVIVDKGKRLVHSKGFPSADRNIAFYLPPNAEDFPDQFKETPLGKAFMWLTELKNLEKTAIDVLREGSSRKDLMLKKIGDGEISKEFIQFTEGLVADMMQKIVNDKTEKGKGGLSLGSGNTNS